MGAKKRGGWRLFSIRLPKPDAAYRRRLISWLQNAAIALLSCTALILCARTGLFGELTRSVLSLGEGYAEPESGAYGEAATPFAIVLTPSSGGHCGVIFDAEAISEAYKQLSTSLAEALGSSGEPERAEADSWRRALSGTGVYMDFIYDQPLALIAGWLGTGMNGGAYHHTARRLCLAVEGEGVSLYYMRARDEERGIYRCDTALSAAELSTQLDAFAPNGAVYCFEEGMDGTDPYVVLQHGQLEIAEAEAHNSHMEASGDAVMDALGMNSYLATTYTEADGTLVSVEGSATLRIDPDGRLRYTRSLTGDPAPDMLPADAVELARVIAEKTVGAHSGAAALGLSYIGRLAESGEYVICFDYVLGGIPVSLPSGEHAMQLNLVGNTVTAASMVFRSYALTGRTLYPMPAVQEAAIVAAAGGGEPRLVYADDLEGVSVMWEVHR